MRHIILGPPGTGKTTKLLSLVDKKLKKGTPPNKIGYFSFTRKATEEAMSRAMKKFDFEKKELPFFRTLHSMAFNQLSLPFESLMKSYEYKKFGIEIGMPLNNISEEDSAGLGFSTSNEFLTHINIARAKIIPLKEQWARNAKNIAWIKLDWMNRSYEKFKKINTLYDYTDMLSMFVEKAQAPSLDYLFIDEAQDLSVLQWQAVEKLSRNAKETYIAGDDDQAIFRWAGADVEFFIKMKGEVHILKQSYRVPKSIHPLSMKIVNRIRSRRKKEYLPRDYEGSLHRHRYPIINMSEGNWLILATTNYILDNIEDDLKEKGVFFERRNRASVAQYILDAVRNWENLRKGKTLEYNDILNIYKLMNVNIGVKHGYKNLRHAKEKKEYNIKQLRKDYGLMREDEWYKALDKITPKLRVYIQAALRRGARLSKPKVKLSTVHGAKGSECDNVVLFTDMSREAEEHFYKNSDDQTRVMYVGATRAKDALHIISPQTTRGFPI